MDDINTESGKRALLQSKMKELSVVGFSYMGTYTIDEKLTHLQEIERIRNARKEAGAIAAARQDTVTTH